MQPTSLVLPIIKVKEGKTCLCFANGKICSLQKGKLPYSYLAVVITHETGFLVACSTFLRLSYHTLGQNKFEMFLPVSRGTFNLYSVHDHNFIVLEYFSSFK